MSSMINQLMMLIYSMIETVTMNDSGSILDMLFGMFYLTLGGAILLVVNIVRIILILLGWDPVPVPWI